MKKFVITLVVLGFSQILCTKIYAQERIVQTLTAKDAIIWDHKTHDALLDFLAYPSTKQGEADSLRVSFIRSFSLENEGRYQLKWSIMLDSLERVKITEKSKIHVDGVYRRDSLIITYKYRIVGPLTLFCYNYRDSIGKPTGRPDETISKGHSYIPITVDLFDYFKSYNEWAIKESEKEYEPFFPTIFNYIGSDSTYVLKNNMSKKIVVKVMTDNMQVYYMDNNKSIKTYKFSKEKSHTVDKGSYTRIYPDKGENAPYIEFSDSVITFVDNSNLPKFYANTSKLNRAVNLAKVRGILTDDFDDLFFDDSLW